MFYSSSFNTIFIANITMIIIIIDIVWFHQFICLLMQFLRKA